MNIEIDTVSKTVKFKEDIPLKDLMKTIKEHLKDWENYKLISYEEKWSYYPYYPYTYPIWPQEPYVITCADEINWTQELDVFNGAQTQTVIMS